MSAIILSRFMIELTSPLSINSSEEWIAVHTWYIDYRGIKISHFNT